MKTHTSKLRALAVTFAILATALVQTAFGQTTASTVPVGFITVTLPAAASGTSPSNTALSVPLYNTPDFNGAVASLDTATAFTLTGASLAIFDAANPRFVRVKASATASHVGKFLLVTSNTATQVTVSLPSGVLGDYVAVGDSVEVVPANTLAKLFGPNTAGATSVFPAGSFFQTGATSGVSDNLLIWNGITWETFFNNNTSWRKSGSLTNQNNVIIYPDDGLFAIRRGLTALTLTLMGTVPSTTEQSDLAGAGSTFIPNRFPVDITLLDTGLHSTAGWVTGATAATADKVFIWESTTWGTYFHNGTSWRKSGSLTNQNTKVITAATAMFISKSSPQSTLTQTLPYTP